MECDVCGCIDFFEDEETGKLYCAYCGYYYKYYSRWLKCIMFNVRIVAMKIDSVLILKVVPIVTFVGTF